MNAFPRTEVGGISLSRVIIGTNWFLGYSHTSKAKDNFINSYMTPEKIADVFAVFLEHGIDTVMGPFHFKLFEAIEIAQEKSGKKMIPILTPAFDVWNLGDPDMAPEKVLDDCKNAGCAICMPHQMVTDALVDRRAGVIRDIDKYTKMIRDRDMVPGLASHMPETVRYVDKNGVDAESYIQLYNAAGFLMQVEADWIMRIIQKAKKPVMTIKPLAAGRLLPPVGLAFVWNTIRDQDMVTIGTTTPDEAKEVIELSLGFLEKRIPELELQKTRSKRSLEN